MIYRHSDEHIQEYYERIGINQSSLKLLLSEGVQAFQMQFQQMMKQDDLYYEEKQHFIIGSAVDCYITQGEDCFNERYFSSKLKKKPAEKPMSIVKLTFDTVTANDGIPSELISNYPEILWNACNLHEFYMNRAKPTWQEDNRVTNMLKDGLCQAYWSELIEARGKQILSDEQYMLINSIILSLTTHNHTRDLFKDSPTKDIIYQLPLYFEVENVDCKVLVDMVIIDHENKRIMPIDLKTLGDFVLNFPKSVYKRRYDIQGSFYHEGISHSLNIIEDIIGGKPLNNYQISNFAFIAESTIKPGTPMIFVLDDDIMRVGSEGSEDGKLLGWTHAIDLFKAWSNVEYSLEEMFNSTNGVVWINKDFQYY